MEARLEKEEPTSVDRKPEAAEQREVPDEDAVVKPVKGRKKRHRGKRQAAGRRGKPKELTRRDWLLPAGRCPAVQQWHGVRGTSSRKFRHKEIVDRGKK
jgi:hypothetical protein